ncbi:hypothetical protein BVC80_9099g11 [Macleaya cordata]|uniref:Uncharacterized protein n=1 Tax=Macleaya cordata TaxID=56857 RepID=A0A200PVK8_MACCD|nr:hypothetical protein BVC80_9099g11 [Macleaya cordata]
MSESSTASSVLAAAAGKYQVNISNDLGEKFNDPTVHCQSKESDLGEHTLPFAKRDSNRCGADNKCLYQAKQEG